MCLFCNWRANLNHLWVPLVYSFLTHHLMCVVGEFCFFISFISVFFCVFSVTIMTVRRSWNDLAAYSLNVSRFPTKHFWSDAKVRWSRLLVFGVAYFFLNRLFDIGLFLHFLCTVLALKSCYLSDSTISDKQGNSMGYLIWCCLFNFQGGPNCLLHWR